MKRVRGKKHVEINHDPKTGKTRILKHDSEDDVLANDGSLDSALVEEVYFSDCGCRAPAYGRCHFCRQLSCQSCHGRCALCKVPICLQHAVFVQGQDGGQVRLCHRCFDDQRRRRRLVKAAQTLLSPFIRFENDHEKR